MGESGKDKESRGQSQRETEKAAPLALSRGRSPGRQAAPGSWRRQVGSPLGHPERCADISILAH